MLMKSTDSWLMATLSEWDYPVTREWTVLAHVYDLLALVNSGKKKPKPYPAPWPDENTKKLGSRKPQLRSDVLRQLDRMNPKEENGK